MQILLSIGALIVMVMLAFKVLGNLDLVFDFIIKIFAIPPVMIARTLVVLALLPTAFSMAGAERAFASINPQERQAPEQAQALMEKMSKLAVTSWTFGQADTPGMNFAFRLARSIVRT